MAILTNPVTINNGADHVYTYRGQKLNTSAFATVWMELADTAHESVFERHSDRNIKTGLCRELSRFKKLAPVNGDATNLKPITINLTANFDKGHAVADVEAMIVLMKAYLAIAGLPLKIVQGEV